MQRVIRSNCLQRAFRCICNRLEGADITNDMKAARRGYTEIFVGSYDTLRTHREKVHPAAPLGLMASFSSEIHSVMLAAIICAVARKGGLGPGNLRRGSHAQEHSCQE